MGLGQRAAPRGHVHMCCGLLVVTCDPTRVSRRRARGVCRCQAEACPPQGPSRWAKSCRPSPRPGVLASVPPFLSACGTLPQTKRGSKRCGTQHPAHTPRSCLQPSWPSFICTWHRRGGNGCACDRPHPGATAAWDQGELLTPGKGTPPSLPAPSTARRKRRVADESVESPCFLPVTRFGCTVYEPHSHFPPAAREDRAVQIRHFINNNVTFHGWASAWGPFSAAGDCGQRRSPKGRMSPQVLSKWRSGRGASPATLCPHPLVGTTPGGAWPSCFLPAAHPPPRTTSSPGRAALPPPRTEDSHSRANT